MRWSGCLTSGIPFINFHKLWCDDEKLFADVCIMFYDNITLNKSIPDSRSFPLTSIVRHVFPRHFLPDHVESQQNFRSLHVKWGKFNTWTSIPSYLFIFSFILWFSWFRNVFSTLFMAALHLNLVPIWNKLKIPWNKTLNRIFCLFTSICCSRHSIKISCQNSFLPAENGFSMLFI